MERAPGDAKSKHILYGSTANKTVIINASSEHRPTPSTHPCYCSCQFLEAQVISSSLDGWTVGAWLGWHGWSSSLITVSSAVLSPLLLPRFPSPRQPFSNCRYCSEVSIVALSRDVSPVAAIAIAYVHKLAVAALPLSLLVCSVVASLKLDIARVEPVRQTQCQCDILANEQILLLARKRCNNPADGVSGTVSQIRCVMKCDR